MFILHTPTSQYDYYIFFWIHRMYYKIDKRHTRFLIKSLETLFDNLLFYVCSFSFAKFMSVNFLTIQECNKQVISFFNSFFYCALAKKIFKIKSNGFANPMKKIKIKKSMIDDEEVTKNSPDEKKEKYIYKFEKIFLVVAARELSSKLLLINFFSLLFLLFTSATSTLNIFFHSICRIYNKTTRDIFRDVYT